MIYKDKNIGFAPELVPLIKNGSKTLTYRLGDKWNFLNIGDLIGVDSNDGKPFAEVEIVEREETTFDQLPINRTGHEIYSSEEEKYKAFEKHYGRKIDPKGLVIVFKFKIIKFL